MRAVIQLNDYDPADGKTEGEPYDPHHDPRSVVNGVETEWYAGSGNLHVTDDGVEEVAELVDGSVSIVKPGEHQAKRTIRNAELVTVRQGD